MGEQKTKCQGLFRKADIIHLRLIDYPHGAHAMVFVAGEELEIDIEEYFVLKDQLEDGKNKNPS